MVQAVLYWTATVRQTTTSILFNSRTCILFQNGLNALHLASKEGHVDVVAELLKLGANVDAATKVSLTHTQSLQLEEMFVSVSDITWCSLLL